MIGREDGTNVAIIDRFRIAPFTEDRGATWDGMTWAVTPTPTRGPFTRIVAVR